MEITSRILVQRRQFMVIVRLILWIDCSLIAALAIAIMIDAWRMKISTWKAFRKAFIAQYEREDM